MKLYVLYEEIKSNKTGHRYFTSRKKAYNALCYEIDACDYSQNECYWKIIEVETED